MSGGFGALEVAVLGVEEWLVGMSPTAIYLLVASIILLESMGVPLPGEITLVSASLLAVSGVVSVWGVAISACVGAIIGDSIGYSIGRRGGRALLERAGRRFPKHFGPAHLARAELLFAKWGVWAVFFGRFVALLRILAGPLAGALRVPYRKFLVANAAGGVAWAGGTAFVIYFLGQTAEKYLKGFSWVALVLAVACGIGTTVFLKRRATKATALAVSDPTTQLSPLDRVAVVVAAGAHNSTVMLATPPPRPRPRPWQDRRRRGQGPPGRVRRRR